MPAKVLQCGNDQTDTPLCLFAESLLPSQISAFQSFIYQNTVLLRYTMNLARANLDAARLLFLLRKICSIGIKKTISAPFLG